MYNYEPTEKSNSTSLPFSFIGTFTPIEQGAHIVDVTLKDEHMINCPQLIQVTDGSNPASFLPPPLSLGKTLVRGVDEGAWEGEVKELVISPCDAAGNILQGVSRERVQVVFTNARGGVEKVNLKEVSVDGHGKKKGELVATFVPSVAGVGGVVCVLVDGVPIDGFPCTMTVKRRPPKLDVQKTVVKGVGEVGKVGIGGVGGGGRCVAGGKHGISVFPLLEGGYTIEDVDLDRVGVRVWKKEGGRRGKEEIVELERGLGGMVGTFAVGSVGEYEVEVTVDGEVVGGVGGVWAVEGVDLGKTEVTGLEEGKKRYVGRMEELKVVLRNGEGGVVRGGKERVEVVIVNAKGVREVVEWEELEGGELAGKWMPGVEGECFVSVYVDGEMIMAPSIMVLPSSSLPSVHPGSSVAYGPGLGDIVRGEGTHFFVQLNDAV